MGRMKDKFIEEQEKLSLDSLYDAKHYEIKDMEYEFYLNSEQYFDDIEAQADEDAFINELANKDEFTITRDDIHKDISERMPYSSEDVE